MNQSVVLYNYHVVLLTSERILLSTSSLTGPFPPRYAEMCLLESAKRSALPGTLDLSQGFLLDTDFARFESREVAERVIKEYHSALTDHDSVKLFLRFADTKAQKQLKQQSQERRNWRSREYSYSVEHTPSPTLTRLQNMGNHISPNGSYQSPAGASNTFTPATSVSPA
jgi:hypothetical protein